VADPKIPLMNLLPTDSQARPNQASTELTPENLSDFVNEPEDLFKLEPEAAPAALEALLFMAGDPIPVDKLATVTGLDKNVLVPMLEQLAANLQRDPRRGLFLRQVEDKYQLATKPEQLAILERLYQPRHRPPLSQPAYETLAIIAYNQPVTRAQVEAVRGVNSDSIISRLIERDFICEVGNLDTPGRPTLFATTEQFLLDFGLRSVSDLPPMEMMMYGTLRDLEMSLELASGHNEDKQVTIDQLVAAFLPEQPSTAE
jgi:segregation and condensation protein B